ncbi:hydroxypyruvate isomerase family protein [Flagellimonas aequoris]|uniref:TIM barrel protein n=1 Tax=Flagellimonas aequoris TaxID=2306997 RepID=A0A418N7Q2_9FLAO|nr:TIM barrel protein [Allomuricauda aequoris]RIV71159.1 xylose isomerase [Allomuricauda aequoris]TXK02532.1 TIM barrel protein [Allomuricauda aequoris]
MNRRDFVKKKMVVSAALGLGGAGVLSAAEWNPKKEQKPFNLNYAPHLGMFKESAGNDPNDQLNFMADMGFTAFEDNEMKGRDQSLQEKMAKTMMERGIAMGVFVAHEIYWDKPNLASGDVSLREKFLKEIKESIEVAKRVNAKWMTVVPGHVDLRLRKGYQTANVIESLKRACSLLEPHGLTMVLEPLNFHNHPGLFLTDSPQAFEICKSVDSPSCKILFDIYHQQIQEGNLIPNIDACWDEIGYFQVGDNPGRNEPTTGEINFKNVFKHIHSKGFTGIVGMEHGNSMEGKEGEAAVIEAYRVSDSF